MAENFDLIFGQSASSQYAWNDSDYQNGWETVGSTPPTAEQFDALQRRNDKKAQELNNALTPLVNQNTASNRQPLTAYALKDIRYYNGLPVGWYLECSTAGTSGSGDITLPTPLVENATITDGTVVWTIRKVASTSDIPAPVDISGKANVDLSNLTDAGKSFSFPSGAWVNVPVSGPGYVYTSPTDGYCSFYAEVEYQKYGFVRLQAGGMVVTSHTYNNEGSTLGIAVLLPVTKGVPVTWGVQNAINYQCRFYYANGEIPA